MKKLILIFAVLFLTSCAISNQAKWQTVPIDKQWPDGYTSWTYKRCCGQDLVWAIFGNDTDGVTPYFKGRIWKFWEWWPRNWASNLKKFVIGYMFWKEGDPWASHNTDHLEYCYVVGDWDSPGFRHIGVKPKNRSWIYWRPYFGYHSDFLSAWIGWKRRGQFACSIKKED